MKKPLLKIDEDAILYNYRHLKCAYEKNIIAVLKDDAYGFGLLKVANLLKNEDGIIFAVKNFDEALQLRLNHIDNDILVLGVFEEKDLAIANKYNLTVLLVNISQLSSLKKSNVKFHIKVNTGMNRLGVKIGQTQALFNLVFQNEDYRLTGIMTHFATKDEDNIQYEIFKKCLASLDTSNLIIHCFSSSSIKKDNLTTHARIGLKLYGFSERSAMLKNALDLYCPVVCNYKIKRNEKVGYDFMFTAPEDGYLYILPIGYNDGWGRLKISYAYSKGLYLKQAGNISMDFSAYFSATKIDFDEPLQLIGIDTPLEHLATLNGICLHEILLKITTSLNKPR